MVNVGDKATTNRTATAQGFIQMLPQTLQMIKDGQHKKGDVLAVARIAGIMAAKQTANLVPLCHPLAISYAQVQFSTDAKQSRVHCSCTVQTCAQTGVEMEALTATQIALLTIYDMCKSSDKSMTIEKVQLLAKNGGKSGHWQRES